MSINQRGGKLSINKHNQQRIIKPTKQDKNISFKKSISNETYEIKDENSNELLSHILDTINKNSLNIFYPDSNNEFKKKIDSLNLKFYLETEKYLSKKNKSENCQTSLFIILFKQINIYIEEIERLNLIIIKGKYDPKKIIERTDGIIKKQNEFLTKEKLIKTLKESKSNMESKLLESLINEDKLKKEIQCLKKENDIFKKQLFHKDTKFNLIKKNDLKKNKTKNLFHKLTHPTFHSSNIKKMIHEEIGVESYTSKGKSINGSQIFENGAKIQKRNSSDNKSIIFNNSYKKLDKIKPINFNYRSMIKGGKLLFKNFHKISSNSNNNSISTNSTHILRNNTHISTSNYFNKKTTVYIKLNNIYDNNYSQNNTQSINISDLKSSDIDYSGVRPIKTEYFLSDLDDYKKGFQYESKPEIKKTKGIRVKFYNSNSNEKKGKKKIEKDNINKKNKENVIYTSSKQISSKTGKNQNERKKIKR